MNRSAIIAFAAVAAAVVTVACSTETTVLPPDRASQGVSVSGAGSAFGEPDIAELTLGVQTEASTVAEARAQAAEAMDAMLDALKDGGVAEEDLQTTRFSVQPVFDFVEDRQELRGFTVDNRVLATIRAIDDTGGLIDAALEAGGNAARVDGLRFTIDDPSTLEDEARRGAMAEARAKAETLADEAGVSLGAPISISESGGVTPIPFDAAGFAEEAQARPDTPIETGELEIQVQVQVVYELE